MPAVVSDDDPRPGGAGHVGDVRVVDAPPGHRILAAERSIDSRWFGGKSWTAIRAKTSSSSSVSVSVGDTRNSGGSRVATE
jgi:hypothetical protein